MSNKFKKETVEEFLARGGSIKKIPSNVETESPETIISRSAGGPVTILSMEDAELFYGKGKPLKPKKSTQSRVDMSALPESLRKKFLAKLLNEGLPDGEEEDSSGDEEDEE